MDVGAFRKVLKLATGAVCEIASRSERGRPSAELTPEGQKRSSPTSSSCRHDSITWRRLKCSMETWWPQFPRRNPLTSWMRQIEDFQRAA